MIPSDILRRAADLIEPEGAWKPHGGNGKTCWCAAEAIGHATWSGFPAMLKSEIGERSNALERAHQAMKREIAHHSIMDWNDAPGRTQAEVVSALRQAAESVGG